MKKEYNLLKSPTKTAKENNLILTKNQFNKNVLYDFSLLDTTKQITDKEKEYIKTNAIGYISASQKEQMYTYSFNPFAMVDGIAYYNCIAIYNTDGKRLYTIMQLKAIKHTSGKRQSVYDKYYDTTETILKNGYSEPYKEIEIA